MKKVEFENDKLTIRTCVSSETITTITWAATICRKTHISPKTMSTLVLTGRTVPPIVTSCLKNRKMC